jgi:hypothetical protein
LSTDLQVVFSNILLNLRRLIRECLLKNPSLVCLLDLLKQLEAKLYYLSAMTLPAPAAFARVLANDILH